MDESRKNNISPWTQHAGENEGGGGGSFKLFMTSSLDELTEQHFIFIN